MPSFPQDTVVSSHRRRLLPLSFKHGLWQGSTSCFDHLAKVIYTLEQHSLRMLMSGHQFIHVSPGRIQRILQSFVLSNEQLFSIQTLIDGFFEQWHALGIRFGAHTNPGCLSGNWALRQLLADRRDGPSPRLIDYVSDGEGVSPDNSFENNLVDSLSEGVS